MSKILTCTWCGTDLSSGYLCTCKDSRLYRLGVENAQLKAENEELRQHTYAHFENQNAILVSENLKLKARVEELEEFARDCRDNYDHSSDAHKHNNLLSCRVCKAEKLLKESR